MELGNNSDSLKASDSLKLQAFVHAARNDLNIISMGIQSIEDLVNEPEKIKEILEVVRSGGLNPLREKLELIQNNASSGNNIDTLL